MGRIELAYLVALKARRNLAKTLKELQLENSPGS